MTQDVYFSKWKAVQRQVAECRECITRWPEDLVRPLQCGEIPEPPATLRLLFVGVAPTPEKGTSKGSHFYSSSEDLLRRGLFRILGEKFRVPLVDLDREEGNRVFHGLGCFFVHAAKVRPVINAAPPVNAIRFCAWQHLRIEILTLSPGGICFLGTNNAGPAAEELFGNAIGASPILCKLNDWEGLVAVAHQPRRGWETQTKIVIDRLWEHIENHSPGTTSP